MRRSVGCLVAVLCWPAGPAAAAVGDVEQKAAPAGCVSQTGTGGGCATGTALDGARGTAISPDGTSVYVAASGADAVVAFTRAADGTLVQSGCVSQDGTGGACATGRGLDGVLSVAVAADGTTVHASGPGGVTTFDRGAGGALTQKAGAAGCLTPAATAGCDTVAALAGAQGIALSADGISAYLSTTFEGGAVVRLSRSAGGVLTASGNCLSASGPTCAVGRALVAGDRLVVSPDGANVYAASQNGAIAVLARAPGTGAITQTAGAAGCVAMGSANGCGPGTWLGDTEGVAVSPDGTSVYAGGTENVAIFDRGAGGALTEKPAPSGCITSDPPLAGCAGDGRALNGASSVVVSGDGRSVYVGADQDDALVAFDRAPDGTLVQKPGGAGCIGLASTGAGCRVGHALGSIGDVVVSPDGRSVYAGALVDDAVTVFDRVPLGGAVDPPPADGGGGPPAPPGGAPAPVVPAPPLARQPAPAVRRPALKAADVITLPSTRRCVSRRNFRIRLRRPRGVTLTSAEVVVNGRRVRTLRGRRITSRVDLRSLPKGRFTVRITVRTSDGRTLRDTRRYRTCVPRRRR